MAFSTVPYNAALHTPTSDHSDAPTESGLCTAGRRLPGWGQVAILSSKHMTFSSVSNTIERVPFFEVPPKPLPKPPLSVVSCSLTTSPTAAKVPEDRSSFRTMHADRSVGHHSNGPLHRATSTRRRYSGRSTLAHSCRRSNLLMCPPAPLTVPCHCLLAIVQLSPSAFGRSLFSFAGSAISVFQVAMNVVVCDFEN